MIKPAFLIQLFVFSIVSTHALVDYGEQESTPVVKRVSRPKSKPRAISRGSTGAKSSGNSSGINSIQFKTSYQSMDVAIDNAEGAQKYGLIQIQGKIDTSYNFYVMGDYWQGRITESADRSKGADQKGNPSLRVGLKWFESGGKQDGTRADLIAGLSMGQSDSEIAHSRDDRIFGLTTYKRFFNMVLLLSGEYRDTGTPENSSHLSIGNILGLTASLGWIVSNDIRMSLSAHRYRISQGNPSDQNPLLETISVATLVPRLSLTLVPMVELDIYGVFRTNKPVLAQGQDLTEARLLDIPGAYGNTIGASIGLSL